MRSAAGGSSSNKFRSAGPGIQNVATTPAPTQVRSASMLPQSAVSEEELSCEPANYEQKQCPDAIHREQAGQVAQELKDDLACHEKQGPPQQINRQPSREPSGVRPCNFYDLRLRCSGLSLLQTCARQPVAAPNGSRRRV
jgi:hypothetical protein